MTAPQLDVLFILQESFRLPWRKRRELLGAAGIPMAILLAVMLTWNWLDSDPDAGKTSWWIYGVYCLIYVMVAVRCHRVYLSDERVTQVVVMPGWGWADTRFLLISMALLLMMLAFAYPIMAIALQAPSLAESVFGWRALFYAAILPGAFLTSRYVLMLPAAALDRPIGFHTAWALSRGNSVRLAIIAAGLPCLLSIAADLLTYVDEGLITGMVLNVMLNLLTVIEVAALSMAYRVLQGRQGGSNEAQST